MITLISITAEKILGWSYDVKKGKMGRSLLFSMTNISPMQPVKVELKTSYLKSQDWFQ